MRVVNSSQCKKIYTTKTFCMRFIDFVIMAPGSTVCLIFDKISDVNIKTLVN